MKFTKEEKKLIISFFETMLAKKEDEIANQIRTKEAEKRQREAEKRQREAEKYQKNIENGINENKKYIRGIRELSEALDISPMTALALTQRDDFPSARIGKIIVTPIDDLKKWLANGGTEPKVNRDVERSDTYDED